MEKSILSLIVSILLYVGLIISVYTDIKYGRIKNYITFPLIIIGLVSNLCFYGLVGLFDFLLSTFLIFVITIIFAFSGGIGMGDGIIILICSCSMTYDRYLSFLFFSFLASAAFSLVLVLTKKVSRKKEIPFVPFMLFVGVIISILELGGGG